LKTRRKLNAGQPGTKKLIREYGDKLVCVRYQYDNLTWRKQRTIELVLDEDDWIPKSKDLVHIQVKYGEKELGIRVKQNGGIWNRKKQLWELPINKVLEMGLTDSIVPDK